ncbi:MAG: tRNA lysidine(34) synthetase TilS [Cytophagales bacterium]|nr:tRNA lysidine(34) synthetase TilS [Cytophagales bacterium]
MVNKLLSFIQEQKLFHREEKILLAVSGGVDSMVLLDLFNRAKFNFAIAHCNFMLRGSESDSDQKLVEDTAINLIVPFYRKSFETEKHAKSKGISIQMAARHLRRAWFEKLLEEEGYPYIATAHHLNDSIETTLFNLTKGTGISGLKGISPKSECYIRPLMFATRKMIFEYATENNLSWREDRSNQSTRYSRNLIRHKVIPQLKKINPSLEETYSYSMEKIAYADRIYREVIDQHKRELLEKTSGGFRIDIKKIASIPDSKIVLFEVLEDFGFNFHQIKNMIISMEGQPGKTFLSHRFRLVIDRRYLYLSTPRFERISELLIGKETKSVQKAPFEFFFERIDESISEFAGDANIAYMDFDKLEFPLKIRAWEPGDRFHPLGMKHKKKLSDFMIDNKIPLNLKDQVLVLLSGNHIVWVVGLRIDDRYKITKQTKRVYKICFKND